LRSLGSAPAKQPSGQAAAGLVADLLSGQGLTVVNDAMTGQTHRDRKLLTGDSPLASNNLGHLAAAVLLDEVRATG